MNKEYEFQHINEHELGVCKMVDTLEEAYVNSCKLNDTTVADFKYFRRYMWTIVGLQIRRIEELENLVEQTK